MRWFKFIIFSLLLVLGIYALAMYFIADESKSFTIEKEIDYPIEKVYPQFNNFQNFVRWNDYFSSEKGLVVDYFKPYEGQGSAIRFSSNRKEKGGEMFIRYANENKSLKFQLFEIGENYPYLINIRFVPVSNAKTKIIWYVNTPKLPLLERSLNFWTEEEFVNDLDKSMSNLKNLLSNKVDKEEQLSSIKFDTIMVEKMEGQLLLGVNASTSNKKDLLFKNIVMNHNKVYNYVTGDLSKREDEIGHTILITEANNYKDKEVSYYIGIPISKRISVTDNNFSFRTLNEAQIYSMYYKGLYSGRAQKIQQLLNQAKKDSLRNGSLMETFIKTPEDNEEVILKFSLPVFK